MKGKATLNRIVAKGNLSERNLEILKNTAKHSPVSRLIGHGLIDFQDEFAIGH